ncbi:sucrose-6-phosphate hydrolase [Lacticaseibacillus songhuajiangensis]|jgi:beta-fructofuranosidase|uniref:sucrose-6-phosphate hydrolase n=1 Tax=Lacticaseibacillus songhuajiangensis TaxID=1296539 RepID=UPI0013DDCD74|nr:sucrose-6-phosphate hydrolase [Lacticaseibacillus songhuajiangensis]
MKRWTTEERYAPYASYSQEELAELQNKQRTSKWHLNYHLQPQSGLMNDPNGFVYANGRWHVSYQNFPYGPVHGLKSWHEMSSTDLQHWQDDGLGLQPHAPYSTQGVYSGSAIAVGSHRFLMYTGNVRTSDGGRISSQLGAWVATDGSIHELSQPLIDGQPEGYTAHFRDPQILAHDGRYYAILGAQRADLRGTILVYSAPTPEGPWQFDGPLDFGFDSLGYMIECPNLAFADGKVALIFCPQGLDQNIQAYANIYPNMYLVADGIDLAKHKLVNPGPLHSLDAGFDCYAAQVANSPEQGARLISWLGLPDSSYASDAEDWQGCYSLVRELHIRDQRLIQLPVVDALIGAPIADLSAKIKLTSVLHLEWDARTDESVFIGNDHEGLTVHVTDQTISVDRANVAAVSSDEFGHERSLQLPAGCRSADLYLDASCFELYLADGRGVLSGRYFPATPTDWRVQQQGQARVRVSGREMARIF